MVGALGQLQKLGTNWGGRLTPKRTRCRVAAHGCETNRHKSHPGDEVETRHRLEHEKVRFPNIPGREQKPGC